MIKDLFPLNTFQQDAVLKRLNEISSKAVSVEEIEDGELENAKPIYCHPISIDREGEGVNNPIHIALLIFDNSNEEYNTYAKLYNKFNVIFGINPNAVFPITGTVYYGDTSAVYVAQKIELYSGVICIRATRPNGTQGYFQIQDYVQYSSIYDGVNKIN